MAINSPQAVLPKVNPLAKGTVMPPEIFVAAGDCYNASNNPPLMTMHLQNNSNVAVKVCLNDVATANAFHYVLKAATGTDTGDGGELTIDLTLGVNRVSLYNAGAIRVVGTRVISPNGNWVGRL